MIQYQLRYVKRALYAAQQRKVRLEDLMQRRSAPKKWDAAKKATMVRRLVTATQTIEQCVAAVDELTKKLEESLAKMPVLKEEAKLAASNPEAFSHGSPVVESPFGS